MASDQSPSPDRGLTLRELVLEIRGDVKELRAEVSHEITIHDERINLLENHTLILRGAWISMGVFASVVTGMVGLMVGLYSVI